MSRLKAALDPRSIAIIGAAENSNKVGGRPVHYLDKFGFKGRIFPINPSRALLAMTALPPVKDNAGDDEHCRHRQHLRKRFRGRPLGGFLHAVLPRPGRDSSLRENARTTATVYSEHPATSIRLD